MSGVQVKSYLFPEQAKATMANVTEVEEIRRFNLSLDSSKPGLYQTMIEKIQQAYGALLPHKEEIRTYWQDDEGELIGFTSDSELQYAIDVVTALKVGTPYEKNLLFKVYSLFYLIFLNLFLFLLKTKYNIEVMFCFGTPLLKMILNESQLFVF
jgi:hypothetical protein